MTRIKTSAMQPQGSVLGATPCASESAVSYRATGGYSGAVESNELLRHLAMSGLRGRSGGGFPLAEELYDLRERGGLPVVVANGVEGEPGSVKDRWLMRSRPHLVLDGVERIASIIGAVRGFFFLSDHAAGARVREALTERQSRIPIEVVETARTYVVGEESAAGCRVGGEAGLSAARPSRPFRGEVGGLPTLVASVETLARVALVATRPDLRQTIARRMLVTLSGGSSVPILTEVHYGVSLRTLAATRGIHDAIGVLVGGLSGALLDARALSVPLDPEALASVGTSLGSGAVRFLAAGDCPVTTTADALDHLGTVNSRQCKTCVSGTTSMRDSVLALVQGTAARATLADLERRTRVVRGRDACGLLSAAAGITGSLLHSFHQLVELHLNEPCRNCAAAQTSAGHERLVVAVPEVADVLSSSRT